MRGDYRPGIWRRDEFGWTWAVLRHDGTGVISPIGFARTGKRPPTNPWRHAYVRAKHFRRAADSFARAGAVYLLMDGPRSSRYAWCYQNANALGKAAESCAWGAS